MEHHHMMILSETRTNRIRKKGGRGSAAFFKRSRDMFIALLIGLVVLLADQALKWFILQNFYLGETRAFIPGVLQLTYVQNRGMAFGFLANHQWVPLVLTPFILGALSVFLAKNKSLCPVQRLALICMMAGGLGNWIDRLIHGFVVDMFEPVFIRFAVFNIADIFITLGGITFVVAYVAAEWRTIQAKRNMERESSNE